MHVKDAIQVEDLCFAYGMNKIINHASFVIKEGEITTIMGANGCGKSTLFSLMTKNLTAAKGTVCLYGNSIETMTLSKLAQQVAVVHQYNTATEDITVEELISYGRTPYKKPFAGNSEEDARIIQWSMEVTDVEVLRDREIGKLSGGQRQRVWIAMALAQGTKLLLLDEPTTYLDIRYQIELLQLIQKLNQEYQITVIMILHDINQAIQFSDRIIGLKQGKVIVQGKPDVVITPDVIEELYGIRLKVITVEGMKTVLTQ